LIVNNIPKILILKTLLLWSFFCFGQLESNIWYFGSNCGLNFSTSPPTILTNGVMSTIEGVATICNSAGQLLFYTNGVTVWNRNHLVMTNGTGLFGDPSTTQSALAIEWPGNPGKYVLFTADNDAGPNGICYSIIDMNLSGGLGAVTTKNTLLRTPSCEKLEAIRHANGTDIWVISKDWNQNSYRSWLVDVLGVGSIQAWSIGLFTPSGISQHAYGQIKVNQTQDKLLAATYGQPGSAGNRFELYNFDNSTGWVSNGILLGTFAGAYSVEFSPNGRYAYGLTNPGVLYQWDLCVPNIPASRIQITSVPGPVGSLQLGRDGKIYMSRGPNNFIDVINSPNSPGLACGYQSNYLTFTSSPRVGFPRIASYYFINIPPFTSQINSCSNVTFTGPVMLNCLGQNQIDSYSWNFGDGNIGTGQTISHIYITNGIHTVTLQVNVNGVIRIITTNINTSAGVNFNVSVNLQ